MKKTTIQLLMLLAIVLINFSCSKDRDKEPKIEIDEKNLTACPENANCQYLFTESADLNEGPSIFKTGSYRVFWSNVQIPGMSATLYIKAPMQGKDFLLDKTAILAGRVKLVRNCPACLMFEIPFKEVDGYVKGINLTPGKRTDETRWLLEVNLILEAQDGSDAKSTVSIKQYFYPNFVLN